MEQLNGLDSALVQGETPNAPLHIGALLIYDPATCVSGKLTFAALRAMVAEAVDKSLPILKCKAHTVPLMLDKPYWVTDNNFTIDYHIEQFALPRPANWDTLHDIAARFHALPLNMERPLWQAMFLENLDHLEGIPRGCVGLLFKIHHALADGKVALRIFSALHSLSPETGAPVILPAKDVQHPDFTPPGLLQIWQRSYWHSVSAPFRLTKNMMAITPALLRSEHSSALSLKSAPDVTPAPATPFNTAPSADRIAGHIRLPIETLKALEKVAGCSINDIALCIIAGALREYLEHLGDLPEASLIAGMPIDIRSPGEKKAIGNQISFVRVSLHTDMADVKARLAAIHEASVGSRRKNSRIGGGSLLSLIDNLHPGLLVWGARRLLASGLVDRLPNVINTIATNVPGIPVPCYLCGARLVDYIGFGPLTPTLSLFHVISSTHSHVNISFLGCQQSLSDPAAYAQAMKHSAHAVLSAYGLVHKHRTRGA